MLRSIALATAVAGTLDIIGALILSALGGTGPVRTLQSVASGPMGKAATESSSYAVAGLVVHFAIMAVMVTVFMLAASRIEWLRRNPIASGTAYGVGLWVFMYWVVLPMRWPTAFPPTDMVQIVGQLFCHIALVGIPIAFITRSLATDDIRELRTS